MIFLPLYIDPGTGSMLFTIVVGAATTLFFLAKAAIIKVKIILSGKKGDASAVDSSYKPYVIYCEGKQYWNVFKPVADEFEKRQIPLTYYTSAKSDSRFTPESWATSIHSESQTWVTFARKKCHISFVSLGITCTQSGFVS